MPFGVWTRVEPSNRVLGVTADFHQILWPLVLAACCHYCGAGSSRRPCWTCSGCCWRRRSQCHSFCCFCSAFPPPASSPSLSAPSSDDPPFPTNAGVVVASDVHGAFLAETEVLTHETEGQHMPKLFSSWLKAQCEAALRPTCCDWVHISGCSMYDSRASHLHTERLHVLPLLWYHSSTWLRLWEWSVATPSELFDRQVRFLDISTWCLWSYQSVSMIGQVVCRSEARPSSQSVLSRLATALQAVKFRSRQLCSSSSSQAVPVSSWSD